jgi:hypothetical protein
LSEDEEEEQGTNHLNAHTFMLSDDDDANGAGNGGGGDNIPGDEDEDSDDEDSKSAVMSFEDFKLAVSLIIPHVSRWRSLELMVVDYPYMHHALGEMTQCVSAPLLETLQLYFYEDHSDADHFQPAELRDPGFVLFSGKAPKLSNVALWGVHLGWSQSSVYLRNLTDLELAYLAMDVRPTFKELATILHGCPHMHTLTLCLAGPAGETRGDWMDSFDEKDILEAAARGEGESQSIVMLNLPSVRNLSLLYHSPEYASRLLSHMSVPNVTKLMLDFEDDDYTIFADALVHATSSAAHGRRPLLRGLDELKVAGLPCDAGTAAIVLYHLTNLRSINLNFNFVGERLNERNTL